MTKGLVSLTRPRYGKRSEVAESEDRPNHGKRSLHGPASIFYVLSQIREQRGAVMQAGEENERRYRL